MADSLSKRLNVSKSDTGRGSMVFALFAVCVLLTVYGVWSLAVLSRTGDLIIGAYDSPTEAQIYAQAAQTKFNEARLRRLGLDREIYSQDMGEAASELIVELSLERLEAAETLSRSSQSAQAIREVKKAIMEWKQAPLENERAKAANISALFEASFSAIASDGVSARRLARQGVDHYFKISTLSFSASLLIAILFACLFGLQQTRQRDEKSDKAITRPSAKKARRAKFQPAGTATAAAPQEPVQLMQRRIRIMMAQDQPQRQRTDPSRPRR